MVVTVEFLFTLSQHLFQIVYELAFDFIKIVQSYLLANKLLPEELRQVENQVSARTDADSHQDAKELILTELCLAHTLALNHKFIFANFFRFTLVRTRR